MIVENTSELKERIERLKREKNAVILAHYYTRPEVQAVADFLGDSLALSVRAQSVDADVILFAGVHFMAETAKVLCPEKRCSSPAPKLAARSPTRALPQSSPLSRRSIPATAWSPMSIRRSGSRPLRISAAPRRTP